MRRTDKRHPTPKGHSRIIIIIILLLLLIMLRKSGQTHIHHTQLNYPIYRDLKYEVFNLPGPVDKAAAAVLPGPVE